MNTHSIKLIIGSLFIATRQRRINLLWSPDGIEFDYLRVSQAAEQKATNQNCHCHGYTRFLQLENKVLILAVDLPLFNVMFSRQLCVKGYLNRQLKSSMQVAKK